MKFFFGKNHLTVTGLCKLKGLGLATNDFWESFFGSSIRVVIGRNFCTKDKFPKYIMFSISSSVENLIC